MTFTEKYSKILDIVREDIDRINLLDDVNVQEPLKSKLSDILKAPSKHIRALISFLYLKAMGARIDEKQVQYQTAIELVHNASLIHDDVIDNSEIRRTQITLNKEFDSKLAVIAGDYLLAIAMQKVIGIGIPELVDMFCETLKTMTEGEIYQYFEKYKIPSLEQYIKKSEQKTAALFETALGGALLIAGKKSSITRGLSNFHCSPLHPTPLPQGEGAVVDELASRTNAGEGTEFAQNFGIAFQIRDDLKNCLTSKTDINDGVYTAPVIFSDKKEITNDGIEKTKVLLNNYLDKARKTLDNIEENEYKSALLELLELLKDE